MKGGGNGCWSFLRRNEDEKGLRFTKVKAEGRGVRHVQTKGKLVKPDYIQTSRMLEDSQPQDFHTGQSTICVDSVWPPSCMNVAATNNNTNHKG